MTRRTLTIYLAGLCSGLAVAVAGALLDLQTSRQQSAIIHSAIETAERWESLAYDWCDIARRYDPQINCWRKTDI